MDTSAHVQRLKSIAQAEVPVKPATEHHRYYWLEPGHLPEPLKNKDTKNPEQLTDYQAAVVERKSFGRAALL